MAFMNYPFAMNLNTIPGYPMAPVIWTPELMAQWHQMYAQFLSQYNTANPLGSPIDIPPPQVNPLAAAAPDHMPPMQVAAAAEAAPIVAPGVLPAPRINAGAAAAAPEIDDDDDLNNRDWLDWFYWMSRAVVLFTVVYFYSSFTRFMLVVGFAILMYLYQMGLIFRPDAGAAGAAGPAAEEPEGEETDTDEEPLPDAPRIEERPLANLDRAISGHRRESGTAATSDTERFSGLRLVWVIISSLFTSLIPDQAPANFN